MKFRSSPGSHALVQLLHNPSQSVSRGQKPSPGWHVLGDGQVSPYPDLGVISVHVRSIAGSHALEQFENVPKQSMSAGHWPSPGWHDRANGHAAPLPSRALVSFQVRTEAGSHALVHADQFPAQSIAKGGGHGFLLHPRVRVVPFSASHACPPAYAATSTSNTCSSTPPPHGSLQSDQFPQVPTQSGSGGHVSITVHAPVA